MKPRNPYRTPNRFRAIKRRITMAHPVIEADECIACGVCVDDCPQGVLELQDVATVVDEDSCIGCGVCLDGCPSGAITEIAED
nr:MULTISPECIES: 4Fe-4S binding protein [Enorma]